jgi:glycerol-3-phosphate acyltransferase PlsY
MIVLLYVLFVGGAYALGSVPVGLLLARRKGIDITKVGSGNIGATNVFRSVGRGWGIATFAGDALKGFVPAFALPKLIALAGHHSAPAFLGLLFGCAAIAGHNWPVFLRFKGGKGVATSAGVLLGVAPLAMVFGLVSWIALFILTRYVSIASIGAALVVPIVSWNLYFRRGALLPFALTMIGFVVVWRHRANIARLMDGTEHRMVFKVPKSAPGEDAPPPSARESRDPAPPDPAEAKAEAVEPESTALRSDR